MIRRSSIQDLCHPDDLCHPERSEGPMHLAARGAGRVPSLRFVKGGIPRVPTAWDFSPPPNHAPSFPQTPARRTKNPPPTSRKPPSRSPSLRRAAEVCVERTLLSGAFDPCPEKREWSTSNRTGPQPDAKSRESIPPSGAAIQPRSPALRFAIGRATRHPRGL
jgi:hypothetical protein